MRWHAEGGNKDGIIRHPKDGEAWKRFDTTHPEFAFDARNVRLGLASDGFNPFGAMSINYSIWPVILIPYNLPPWLCMRQSNSILSMIIPGPRMAGNNIDVYLQPLIKELNELWREGIETFDSSKNEMFRIRAAPMWTISDFSGLGILSSWNTYTDFACPSCNFDMKPCRLHHSKKWCFVGHRRYLANHHKFRLRRHHFDGTVEERPPPEKLFGSHILQQVRNVEVTFGRQAKLSDKRKRNGRTSVDVMHIEKNVFDNIIYTLLNDREKSKDNIKARRDLRDMGIRQDLWPDAFTIPKEKKVAFLATLKNISMPDGYSSNISRCIHLESKRIFGLESHDCHIIMEQLLPIAIRNVLPDQVVAVLVEFCSFFRHLCLKNLSLSDLEKLQKWIVTTLCHLEIFFPPSLFTVMVHLTVHLVDEIIQGGLVHYRWMYFVERLLGHFNSVIGNKSQAEGCIAEGRVVGGFITFHLSHLEKTQAHRYVLLNSPAVHPFIYEFRQHIRRSSRGRKPSLTEVEKRINREFVDWFPKRIMNPDIADTIHDDIKFLAQGPAPYARRFTAYNINGFKFELCLESKDWKLKIVEFFLYLTLLVLHLVLTEMQDK